MPKSRYCDSCLESVSEEFGSDSEHQLMGRLNIPVVNAVRFGEPDCFGHRHDLL